MTDFNVKSATAQAVIAQAGFGQKSTLPIMVPVLERLGAIAAHQKEDTDLIALFHTRLEGGPSVLTPPGRPLLDEAAPISLDGLLASIEKSQAENRQALLAITGRF